MKQKEPQTNVERVGIKLMNVAMMLEDAELRDLGVVLTSLGANIIYELIGEDEDEAYALIDEALYDRDPMLPKMKQFMSIRKNREAAMKNGKLVAP